MAICCCVCVDSLRLETSDHDAFDNFAALHYLMIRFHRKKETHYLELSVNQALHLKLRFKEEVFSTIGKKLGLKNLAMIVAYGRQLVSMAFKDYVGSLPKSLVSHFSWRPPSTKNIEGSAPPCPNRKSVAPGIGRL